MSRHGYRDDWDDDLQSLLAGGRWKAQLMNFIRGKRGQAFLREMIESLDAMPVKRLVPNAFETPDGEVCMLGTVGRRRGLDMTGLLPDDPDDDADTDSIAHVFNIGRAFAAEVMYENDEGGRSDETPEQRWVRMRRWCESKLIVWDDAR